VKKILTALEKRYGRPGPPRHTGVFHQVLHENVAYLVSDDRREAAFDALAARVGLTPATILAAPTAVLREVAALGGMMPDLRVGKLLRCAEIARKSFDEDVEAVTRLPLDAACKALQRFPSLGRPGAEKVLLTAGSHPVLALDSNALRVLLRLGYGQEKKSYAATYTAVQAAAARDLPRKASALLDASRLLRRHGQETCRRTKPQCPGCCVNGLCRFYTAGTGKG
jgi:endonuclease-3